LCLHVRLEFIHRHAVDSGRSLVPHYPALGLHHIAELEDFFQKVPAICLFVVFSGLGRHGIAQHSCPAFGFQPISGQAVFDPKLSAIHALP
jgi:hypothetical protein